MSMMKVAGKNPSGNAAAFAVNANGNQLVEHAWVTEEILAADSVEIRDTSVHTTSRYDVGEYGLLSLRVYSSLDQPLNIQILKDTEANNTTYMYSSTGGALIISLPASDGKIRIVTPDDLPYLPYLHHLRFRLTCSTAPTTGFVKITIVGRR